jgi:hypothetical protein
MAQRSLLRECRLATVGGDLVLLVEVIISGLLVQDDLLGDMFGFIIDWRPSR